MLKSIRDIGTEGNPEYLMTMHGMFWHFPETFSTSNSAGIRPRGAYLKVMADFARWGDRVVFGCDDSAQSEFLNKRKQKGSIGGPGQSNSNLWFGTPDTPDQVGPTNASGSSTPSTRLLQARASSTVSPRPSRPAGSV